MQSYYGHLLIDKTEIKIFFGQKSGGGAFLLCIACATCLSAQRDPRQEIEELTQPEADGLANLINGWLDDHTDLTTTHFSQFFTIHNTKNFFPWHRAHIRELEEAIGFMAPSVLPRWQPRGAGDPGNPMPEPFRWTHNTPPVYGMPDFDPLVQIPGNIALPGACGLGIDDYSNLVQSDYHDLVHSAVGGLFLSQEFSATVIGFWPWHAWVDEFWYNWENTCTAGYTDFPNSGSTEIIINSTVTWSGEHFVKGKIIIESGGRLNIAPGAVIHFRSSDYEAYETSIVVKPGGLLYVDNATLTGIDYFGTNINGTGGVRYNSGWKGILVEGTGSFGGNHGQASILNQSVIEHASIGIESKGGGRIVARNSEFSNNRRCIYIHDFNFSNHHQFHIEECTFDVTGPLRDVTLTPGDGLPAQHFLHKIAQTPQRYIHLINVRDVKILGGTFKKTNVIAGEPPTTGIEATNARFSCINGATFEPNLELGIAVYNTTSGLVGAPRISGCTFNSREGILLHGADYATISSNTFSNPVTSIKARAASGYDILDNSISGGPGAVSLLSDATTGNHANVIELNSFSGSDRQIQFQFGNPDIQFRCNQFSSPGTYATVLFSGGLPDQGNCINNDPAGNIWVGCPNPESQMFKTPTAPGYVYSSHSDRMPVCVSSGITPNPCFYDYINNPTCVVAPPCLTCPEFPEEGAIQGLEGQKQAWAASQLPPEDIAAIILQLNWEQKIMAQRGLLRVIEADSTLATAFDYLAAVGGVFPFPASDRIGLYLSSGNRVAADNLIAGLPAGNEKELFLLLSTLHAEGRSFEQISPAEEQAVRNIAQGNDQAAAQAKSILYVAFGEKIEIEPEPLNGERTAPGNTEDKKAATAPSLTFAPNPGSDFVTVNYTLHSTGREAVFTLNDVYGRQVLVQPIPADAATGQFGINLHDLPVGVYVGAMSVNGQRQSVSRLTVVK